MKYCELSCVYSALVSCITCSGAEKVEEKRYDMLSYTHYRIELVNLGLMMKTSKLNHGAKFDRTTQDAERWRLE